jgi:hypothetical protein
MVGREKKEHKKKKEREKKEAGGRKKRKSKRRGRREGGDGRVGAQGKISERDSPSALKRWCAKKRYYNKRQCDDAEGMAVVALTGQERTKHAHTTAPGARARALV